MPNKTHTIDASGKILGRLASEIVVLLMGKNTPTYKPYLDSGDSVIVFNIEKIKVTGQKTEKKLYYSHSGYLGSLKTRKYKEVFARDPREVLRQAVIGMLPKNKLRAKRMKRLRLYAGKISD